VPHPYRCSSEVTSFPFIVSVLRSYLMSTQFLLIASLRYVWMFCPLLCAVFFGTSNIFVSSVIIIIIITGFCQWNTPIFIVLTYYTSNVFRLIRESSSGPYLQIQGAWWWLSDESKHVARVVRKYNKYRCVWLMKTCYYYWSCKHAGMANTKVNICISFSITILYANIILIQTVPVCSRLSYRKLQLETECKESVFSLNLYKCWI
jgi:hypothetical protein